MPKKPHEGPALLWIGPLCLALLGLAAGLFPHALHAAISSPMATAVAGTSLEVKASGIPHLGIPLYLSVATIALGIAVYRLQDRLRDLWQACSLQSAGGRIAVSTRCCAALSRLSFAVTRILQNGRLDIYLTVTFVLRGGHSARAAWSRMANSRQCRVGPTCCCTNGRSCSSP